MNPTSPALQSRDEEFFWDSATFLVEGVLFRVPKDRLVHDSEHFSRQYALREQQASSCPIQLDITQEDFRTFLRVLYPRAFLGRTNLSKERWISLLNLSTLWHFNDLRRVAITRLEALGLPPAEKVSLGKQYHVSRWVIAGYDALVRNETGISVQDATQVGFETTVGLYICREQRRYEDDPNYLESVFKDQLASIAEQEARYTGSHGSNLDEVDMEEAEAEKRRRDEEAALRQELRQTLAQLEEERLTHARDLADAQTRFDEALEDAQSTMMEEKEDRERLLVQQMTHKVELQKELADKEALATHLSAIQTRLQAKLSEAQSLLEKERKAALEHEMAHTQTKEILEQQTKLWEVERQTLTGALEEEKATRESSEALVVRLKKDATKRVSKLAELEARLSTLAELAEAQGAVHTLQDHTSAPYVEPQITGGLESPIQRPAMQRTPSRPSNADVQEPTPQSDGGDNPVRVPAKRPFPIPMASPAGTEATSSASLSNSYPPLPSARRKKAKLTPQVLIEPSGARKFVGEAGFSQPTPPVSSSSGPGSGKTRRLEAPAAPASDDQAHSQRPQRKRKKTNNGLPVVPPEYKGDSGQRTKSAERWYMGFAIAKKAVPGGPDS
ncbi:hypothetical protein BKA70DRAFT_124879 [Coprinopsis sp. MPI-PUGE-AT-0042]|nr:hypothetical protein BKA70DRAFT_124879 [Coprinopsis sp. MPI-PUGE-AT-0042]